MSDTMRIQTSDGDRITVRLVVPSNYKFDDEERNDFMHRFGEGVWEKEVERALEKGWVERVYEE